MGMTAYPPSVQALVVSTKTDKYLVDTSEVRFPMAISQQDEHSWHCSLLGWTLSQASHWSFGVQITKDYTAWDTTA